MESHTVQSVQANGSFTTLQVSKLKLLHLFTGLFIRNFISSQNVQLFTLLQLAAVYAEVGDEILMK